MSQPPAVEIEDLWFSYGSQTVLENVTLSLGEREFISFIGPNGGGKTTLLKLLLGLLRPDRGRVRVLGTSALEARPRVGYAPQHLLFDTRFPVSVMDVVLMGRLGKTSCLGFYRRRDREAALQALEEVELTGFGKRPFSELSGGERQRVLIARSLASSPELLLLDEPTASLDAGAEEGVNALLRSLTQRMTVIMVSHDVAVVSESVDKVVCIQTTVAMHPTAELTGEMIRALYGRDIRLVRHDHDCLRRCELEREP
jgi:zinc transport system ATP-binding protein